MCSYAAMGSSMFFPQYLMAGTQKSEKERFRLSKPRWIIYDNGNYDLIADEIILKNCSPAINGQTVMPKNVFLGDSPRGRRIIYELSGGFLMLDLKTNDDSLSIGVEFSGFSRAPRWFYPISQAEVFGAKSFFRQGFGSGGPSGVVPIIPDGNGVKQNNQMYESWSYDSYMTFALMGKNETIAIGNIDCNDFLHRSAIYNRFHRRKLNHREPGDEHIFFESAMLLNQIQIENEYIKLPDLHFYTGNKPFETLQELAWKINQKSDARRGPVTSYHWISKSESENPYSFDQLEKQIEFLKNTDSTISFNTLVINSGYCTVGDWLEPNENWPGGLERASREIFKNGYRAGIWIAPFIVEKNSDLFSRHTDWIIRDFDNNPVIENVNLEGTYYALDASHPDVRKYLARVFHSLQKMGFIFYQMAYLESALKDSYLVKRDSPGKSSVQIFREALRVIRNEIGAGSLIMAEQTAYAPVVGLADIVTISRSTTGSWGEDVKTMIRESYFSQYFNTILWQSNPGEIVLSDNNSFTEDEKISLSLWKGILGGAVGTSDNFIKWNNKQLALYQFLEPDKRLQSSWFPFWPSVSEIKIVVRQYKKPRGWGVLFFNDKDEFFEKKYRVVDLIQEENVFVYSWMPEEIIDFGKMIEVFISLQPHQSRLFWMSEKEEPPPAKLTLGGADSEVHI
jgi:hypothetical protein